MVIKIKLKGLNGISLSKLTCSKSTIETWCKSCSKITIETPKLRHSDVSIVKSVSNFEHANIGRDISLKVLKQLAALRHSILVEMV